MPAHAVRVASRRAEPDRLAERRRVADQPGVDPRERLLHEPVIDGERALREGVLAEHDQADAVAAARAHDVGDDALGELEPRHLAALELRVEREHAARGVERDHEVDARARSRVLGHEPDRARRGEREQRERDARDGDQEREVGRACAAAPPPPRAGTRSRAVRAGA
jgi:hypothetical protein